MCVLPAHWCYDSVSFVVIVTVAVVVRMLPMLWLGVSLSMLLMLLYRLFRVADITIGFVRWCVVSSVVVGRNVLVASISKLQ